MTTLDGRLKILEQRILSAPTTSATAEPFDHDAYLAAWLAFEAQAPEDIIAQCDAELAALGSAPDPPTDGSFDYAAFARCFLESARERAQVQLAGGWSAYRSRA